MTILQKELTAMNKKVLIVSSSPRKHGNSDLLCDEFARGAKDAGNEVEKVFLADKSINYCRGCGSGAKDAGNEVEKVFLADKSINYCRGCGICNSTHKCVQNDDMAELNDKMVKADVIALASPVYLYTVDAQLKKFIDRCVPRYTEMSDKDSYYILTAADSDKSAFDKSIECIRGFTLDCLDRAKEKGIIRGAGVFEKGEIKDKSEYKECYNMGKNV